MQTATDDIDPVGGFPEDRLVSMYMTAVRQAQTDVELRQVLSGALQVGYRRGLVDGAPPLQPEDMEKLAERFMNLANRMRGVEEAERSLTAEGGLE